MLTGWTRAEIEAAPAVELDWLLRIDDLVASVIEKKAEASKQRRV